MAVHAVPEVRCGEPARRDALLELLRLALRRGAGSDPRRSAREDPLPEASSLRDRPRSSQRHRARRALDLETARPHRLPGGAFLRRGRGQHARRLRERDQDPPRRARARGTDPARQRDAQVLSARHRERHRRHGQAAVAGAAAAPAPAGPDTQRHAGAEPGARAGNRRDHAHHRRRARLPAALRQLPGRRPLPGRRGAAAARGAWPRRRQGPERPRHLRAHRQARARHGRGDLDAAQPGRGGVGPAARPSRRGHAPGADDRVPAATLPARRRRRRGRLSTRARGALRRQRRLGGALQRGRAARRGSARPPRRARDRERAAVRARAAHDRGAAEGAEAAAAVREARHHRPDGGRDRPRAQHPAHLHHGQPGAARAAGADSGPARDAVLDRARVGAHPCAGAAPARLQPPGARGDDAARGQRRGRAQSGAMPVPDRERARVAREDARAEPAARAGRLEPARDGADQPGRERGPRDGREGRHARRRHAPPRRRRRDLGRGPGTGHPGEGAQQPVRAVCHHEARGQGHRPRAVDGADGGRAPQRPHRLRHRREPRHDLPHHAAACASA